MDHVAEVVRLEVVQSTPWEPSRRERELYTVQIKGPAMAGALCSSILKN